MSAGWLRRAHVGAGVIIERHCPTCMTSIEFEQWCDDFSCPFCSVMLRHAHDCFFDEETNDAWCDDWLEEAT